MILLILLIFVIVFILSTLLLKFYAEKIFHLMTYSRHSDADFLINTGNAPENWKERIMFKIGLFFSDDIALKLALKRIDSLSAYFKRTPLVESEKSREIILNKFSDLRKKWFGLTWEELFQKGDLYESQ